MNRENDLDGVVKNQNRNRTRKLRTIWRGTWQSCALLFFCYLRADPDEGTGEGKAELKIEKKEVERVPEEHEHRGNAKQVERGTIAAGEDTVVCPQKHKQSTSE